MSDDVGEVIIANSIRNPLVLVMEQDGEVNVFSQMHPLQIIDALTQTISTLAVGFAQQLQDEQEGRGGG